MSRLSLCALGLAALAGPAAAQSEPARLLAAWSAAYPAGSAAPVAQLYAPDARLLSEASAREAVGLEAIAAYFAAMAIGAAPPRLRIDSHDLRETPAAAYVSGRYTLLREGWDGATLEEAGRFSLVLLPAQGGGWRIAGQHSSLLPR